jgi:hypothetical protein
MRLSEFRRTKEGVVAVGNPEELCTCGCGKNRRIAVMQIMEDCNLNEEQAEHMFNAAQALRRAGHK